jgi:uncharacterized protein YfeS
MEEDRDPFSAPETAHPRALDLMQEEFFWDCVDEEAPFGSDEGHDAYYEFRRWRSDHESAPLVECLDCIMEGQLERYSGGLCSDERVEADIKNPDGAFLSKSYDTFTLDATVIATGLAQLLDEGRIDSEAKPYLHVAVSRQSHPRVISSDRRREILLAVARVINAA